MFTLDGIFTHFHKTLQVNNADAEIRVDSKIFNAKFCSVLYSNKLETFGYKILSFLERFLKKTVWTLSVVNV